MEFLTPGSRGIFALGCVLGIAETHLLHRAPPLLSIADSVSIMGDLFRLSLARYINGYPFKPVDWSDRGRPIIRIQNLSDPDADPNFFEGEIPEVYLVKRGDLLLSWSATLGAFEWPGPDAWLNQHIFKVDLDTNRVSKKYYRWLAEWFMRELDSEAHGSTMQHLTKDRFGGFKLQLPPPALQETISNYLDRETTRIDGLIAEKERMLALLEEKRAALVSRVVTRGLDPHAPLKPSGQEWLGEIPAHWAIRPIKYLAVIGNGSTPSVENADYWDDEGYPWLNSSVVNVSPVTDASRFVTETALRECHLPKIQPPAVLVGITGQGKTRGMAAVLGIEATINQHVAFIKPRSQEIDAEYLCYLLGHAYAFLRSDSDGAGSTKGAITCEQLATMKIPVPPSGEQGDICSRIRQSLAVLKPLRAEIRRSLDLLTERRSALITAAVTGQIPLEASAT